MITQGEKGDLFYVAESGEYDVYLQQPGEAREDAKKIHT